ncbi:putative site-specific tyrosine recombinase XerC [Leptospira interrogans serovar Grippotyphosa str. 2006006986]|uniref:Putative site-specific tyrosine recombinase XerC n=4 Tax=Leptospira interrogans TaxID=173 RepID=A0A0E2DAC0_LEPIR|nr:MULTISPECIES: tyrosine-type recombinase/integrase [Leptospira]EKO26102.1 putative site-specific tyrosine recombinase XerC [Leptospira interrogans str. UI 12621]EKO87926.1 putative site-specific tyrosine recombinase XerC [Leptospira interrogans serovar Grippotyphosa str. Andaman]EKP84882.1 putative site-specific tyrosine recombinase XerC [Leptospira interrogans serovar Grippotyphosa str. 2006006986]EKR57043.1 putative site-specific tyrosine recombinase XerC [Leptospira interrogans str. UI 127
MSSLLEHPHGSPKGQKLKLRGKKMKSVKVTDGNYHLHGFTIKGRESELEKRILEYLQSQERMGRSVKTLKYKRIALKVYNNWSEERGLTNPEEITEKEIEGYQRYLSKYKNQVTKERICVKTMNSWLCILREFYLYLEKKERIRKNPCLDMRLPKEGRRLPRNVLGVEEVERILSVPDLGTPLGIRNRAILELFYSTGMRSGELSRLKVSEVDFSAGTIQILESKGRTDRLIPVSERALLWMSKYLEEVRLVYERDREIENVFLSSRGKQIPPNNLGRMVTQTREEAGVEKKGSTHMFRHTTATLMLEHGADIRHVQEMLGHKNLGTTQIYTHVAIQKLQEVYERTHPSTVD